MRINAFIAMAVVTAVLALAPAAMAQDKPSLFLKKGAPTAVQKNTAPPQSYRPAAKTQAAAKGGKLDNKWPSDTDLENRRRAEVAANLRGQQAVAAVEAYKQQAAEHYAKVAAEEAKAAAGAAATKKKGAPRPIGGSNIPEGAKLQYGKNKPQAQPSTGGKLYNAR